jgi:hypothetical protein
LQLNYLGLRRISADTDSSGGGDIKASSLYNSRQAKSTKGRHKWKWVEEAKVSEDVMSHLYTKFYKQQLPALQKIFFKNPPAFLSRVLFFCEV